MIQAARTANPISDRLPENPHHFRMPLRPAAMPISWHMSRAAQFHNLWRRSHPMQPCRQREQKNFTRPKGCCARSDSRKHDWATAVAVTPWCEQLAQPQFGDRLAQDQQLLQLPVFHGLFFATSLAAIDSLPDGVRGQPYFQPRARVTSKPFFLERALGVVETNSSSRRM